MLKYISLVAISAVVVYYVADYSNGCRYNPSIRIDGKVAIVTGGNTGIGKETVKDLIKRGAKVYLACRSLDKARKAMEEIQKDTGAEPDQMALLHLDLASLSSVREFVREFKRREHTLHLLINNAGVLLAPQNITVDGYELTFATNHLGHFLLTQLLADVLLASAPSRVVTVSSVIHKVSTLDFDGLMEKNKANLLSMLSSGWSYAQSKLANILFASELSRKLEGTGVTSYSLHPGTVKSDLVRHSVIMDVMYKVFGVFFKDNWHGSRTSIYCAIEPGLEVHTGKYFSDCAVSAPSSAATNMEDATRLWSISVDMVHLQPHEIHPKLL